MSKTIKVPECRVYLNNFFFNITLVFLVPMLLMKLVSERPKLYISVILS